MASDFWDKFKQRIDTAAHSDKRNSPTMGDLLAVAQHDPTVATFLQLYHAGEYATMEQMVLHCCIYLAIGKQELLDQVLQLRSRLPPDPVIVPFPQQQ